ncbi:hypothetical protein ACM46_17560 [Chryseobacterium angstadtii]|uniref:Uncharacterized protein n=1 Tax=Chryseobacterium angstadtii TaxID=558151 RepID=A0A0J7KS52_9FLAO|nr:hypothetical protein [Chryseobacterium angstadtii]KMQ60055.1 hypothetical protein ACM46_17560 [Chryseobacterium angstadtii]
MKKIYYFPGLISAVLIPLLFLYYGNRKFEEVNFNVIDIWLPAKAKVEGEKSYLSFEPYRNWNYKKIKVVPNTAKENTQLYVAEIRNLQKRNEKNSGIEFILDDHNNYGDLVALLSGVELAGQSTYTLDAEKTWHFFVSQEYKDPNAAESLAALSDKCGNMGRDFPEEHYFKRFQKFQYQITQLPKEALYLIFGFLLLVNISMLSIKERLQLNY